MQTAWHAEHACSLDLPTQLTPPLIHPVPLACLPACLPPGAPYSRLSQRGRLIGSQPAPAPAAAPPRLAAQPPPGQRPGIPPPWRLSTRRLPGTRPRCRPHPQPLWRRPRPWPCRGPGPPQHPRRAPQEHPRCAIHVWWCVSSPGPPVTAADAPHAGRSSAQPPDPPSRRAGTPWLRRGAPRPLVTAA